MAVPKYDELMKPWVILMHPMVAVIIIELLVRCM